MGEVFGQNRNGPRGPLGSKPRSLRIGFASQVTERGNGVINLGERDIQ